jgi:hypothetical protein
MTFADHAAADPPPVASTAPELHHGSHNHLLTVVEPPLTATPRLDAIIVPTFRAVDALRDSFVLARELGTPLVALCSGQAQATRSVALGEELGADVLAIDLHDVRPKMPAFRSDKVLRSAGFANSSDLSLKRNLGLLIGRIAGWKRVLFLDDDIYGVRADELHGAAEVLDDPGFRAVGLSNHGYPDNSVVCHAYRAIGADQDSFIGGGAMIVDPSRTRSFFPNIYNEDWFFLLGDGLPLRAAVSGTMVQRSYDPFATSQRAAGEELGDTLAEGLFWLLDSHKGLAACDTAFWGDFLFRRRRLLDHVLRLVDTTIHDPREREPIKDSLRAARGRSSYINPSLCDAFVRAWNDDLHTWNTFLEHFSTVDGIDKALAELGVSHVATRARQAALTGDALTHA